MSLHFREFLDLARIIMIGAFMHYMRRHIV